MTLPVTSYKLTEDWIGGFLALVEAGVPPYLAAEERGIGRDTLFNWFRLGGHPHSVNSQTFVPHDNAPEPFKSFVQRTLQAEAKSHNKVAKPVYARAKKDPEFGLKWLRHRFAQDWNPNHSSAPQVVYIERPSVLLTFDDWKRLQEEREANGAE